MRYIRLILILILCTLLDCLLNLIKADMFIEIGRRNMAEFGSYKKDERN